MFSAVWRAMAAFIALLFGAAKRDSDLRRNDAIMEVVERKKRNGPQPMPNIFFQLFMACIHGFSAARPCPQMSIGGFMPKIFS